MDTSILNLRATVAMRAEDLRIARKHREEAAARADSPVNVRAYRRALAWEEKCAAREQKARAALVRELDLFAVRMQTEAGR